MDGVLAQQLTRQAEQGIDSLQCNATKNSDIGTTRNHALNENLAANHAILGLQIGANELSKLHGWSSYHNIALQGHLGTTSEQELTGLKSLPPPWATAATAAGHYIASSTIFNSHSSESAISPPHTPPNTSPRTTAGTEEYQAALLKAAEVYRKKDYAHVIHSCLQLHAVDATRSDVLLLLGAAYYQLKDYTRSAAANDAAILLNPSCAEAYANLGNALYQNGSIDLAITYYTSAIRLKSDFIDAYVNLAAAYTQRGLPLPAAQAYSAVLAMKPELTAVRCSLGDLWKGYGDSGRAAAEKCYSVALQTDPQCAAAWRGHGDCAKEAGNFELAVENYKKALEVAPDLFEAHTGLGICLRELRRLEESESAFAVAATLRPTCPFAMGNLAGAYYENKKTDASVIAYRRAISLNPSFSEAFNNLGNALRESGRPHEAVGCYLSCIQIQLSTLAATASTAAIAVAPGTPGRVAHGSPTAGAAALGGSPVSPVATAMASQRLSVSYNNLGGVLKLLGRNEECIRAYEHVVKLQPTVPEGHANLGSAYKDAGRHEAALLSYRTALTFRPDFPEAFANLVHSMQCICDWRDRDVLFLRLEKEVERDLALGKLPSVQPFHAMTYPFAPGLALKISQRYAEECAATVKKLPDAPTEPLFLTENPSYAMAPPSSLKQQQPQRLRIGYVSSDFVNHPLAHLMGSVFGLHDRSKIEVFCYSLSPNDGSEFHHRISLESENFLDVSSWTSPAIARRIAADGIHILFNLNGYTKGARNEIFAMRPAPVQASLMGFPATMGADFIDWIVLDKMVCTEESRECYSESIAYMPDTYFVNDYKRSHPEVISGSVARRQQQRQGGSEEDADTASSDATANIIATTRASLGLPEDKVVYSCSNQLYKYDPETFTTWCNILKRVPDSVLWLLRFPPAGETRVRAEAAARGVDPNRIIFTDVASKPIHVARSGLADVFLDTPACNAHTTGCDVLWGGCPIVTWPVKRMASRVGASLCRATGLGEHMIVKNLEEYEERAVLLGLDHEARGALRAALHAVRETCALFDTARYVQNLDKLVVKMWGIYCEGKGPRDFTVLE